MAFLTAFFLAGSAMVQSAPTYSAQDAARVFGEFRQACEADAGKSWGMSLCGKMMLVDPDSRVAFFNSPPPNPARKIGASLWQGQFPADLNVANTSLLWEGERWLQLIENPADQTALRSLALHEAYHGIQEALGYKAAEGYNAHLEEEPARYWLRLEAAALAAALRDESGGWRDKAADAMRFNRMRTSLYPDARANEATQINHEGLAEYTGLTVGGGEAAVRLALANLASVETRPSLVRSIGYVMGGAYGLLLDRGGMEWKPLALQGAPLPNLIERALDGRSAERAAKDYGAQRIGTEEAKRGAERRAMLADLRARFIEGPILKLPFAKMNISFDPNRVIGLDDIGTIRSGATITDQWGKLTAEGDLLLDKNWSFAIVPMTAPADAALLKGDGWTLELADGWSLVPGKRAGDWTLQGPS